MPEPSVIVLFAFVVALAVWIVYYAEKKKKMFKQYARDLALELGLTTEEKINTLFAERDSFEGVLDGFTVVIGGGSKGGIMPGGKAYVINLGTVLVEYPKQLSFEFDLLSPSCGDVTGDRAFDAKCAIETDDEDKVRRLLEDVGQRQAILGLGGIVKINRESICAKFVRGNDFKSKAPDVIALARQVSQRAQQLGLTEK